MAVADDIGSRHVVVVQTIRGPMAHQFDSVCGNEPTPQIMVQLIGCRVDMPATSKRSKVLGAEA
jgi:hypothetical protein